jgi:uncharacterized protein YkwD
MGVCYNFKKRKKTIKINENNNDSVKLGKNENNKILIISHINEFQYSNFPTAVSESNPQSKIRFSNENGQTHSNLSSASSQMITPHCCLTFNIEATIGEIEIPIYVDKNENIIIQINPQSSWSFLPNENPVNYLGYQKYQYKSHNVGSFFLRITESQMVYHLDKDVNSLKCNSKGSLLFWANLDPNDYSIYEPKGSLSVKIIGGYNINEIEDYSVGNNDNKGNNNDQEKKILKYINKARNDLLQFFNDYFYYNNNDGMNKELSEFIKNNNVQMKELIFCKELNVIAKKHCEDLCNNGTSGDIGTDGLDLKERIKKYKYNSFYIKEVIVNGINNPLLIVKQLIEDKYSKNKNNRKNILFNQLNKIGICLMKHIAYKYCCVIILSD